MAKITLYGLNFSPQVRACLLTLKALNMRFQHVLPDFFDLSQVSMEYWSTNPEDSVPTLEDDGNILKESHAIMAYLVSKYGRNDALYPRDLLQRAAVDQRMHFEAGMVFQGTLRNIIDPILYQNEVYVTLEKTDTIEIVYGHIETFLREHTYIAGDRMTIADFSVISSVLTLSTFREVHASKYPKLTAWIRRLEYLPYYGEVSAKGAQMLHALIKTGKVVILTS